MSIKDEEHWTAGPTDEVGQELDEHLGVEAAGEKVLNFNDPPAVIAEIIPIDSRLPVLDKH
ncbi:hypothetical protein [Fodinicola feengrottensis]|uniref:hypothetical protein n=1 Tax=Fodinicola feengrottensis TaxID=435914 RepID=UPI0013CF8D7A|nr:hypothetical protein [Fodinicola feengrottensis]